MLASALPSTSAHNHRGRGSEFVHEHKGRKHARPKHTHTCKRKVLPRRTSATLSSLKPAKYSLSAAVLSKLPTQARKRYQLPGGGGEGQLWERGFVHRTQGEGVSSQMDYDLRACWEGDLGNGIRHQPCPVERVMPSCPQHLN